MLLTTEKKPFGNGTRTCQTRRNETKGNVNNAGASLGSLPGVEGRQDTLNSFCPILSSPFSLVLDLADEPTQDHNNAIVNFSFFLSIAGLFTISGTVREVSYLNPQDQSLLKARTMKHKTHPASLVNKAGAAGAARSHRHPDKPVPPGGACPGSLLAPQKKSSVTREAKEGPGRCLLSTDMSP